VSAAAHRDNPSVARALHELDELRGQSEVPEVISSELQLEAVGGQASRRCHHAGVVDKQVEACATIRKSLGEATNRRQVAQVQGRNLDSSGRDILDGAARCGALVRVAAGHDHLRTGPSQLARRDQAQAAVGPGHDRRAALLAGYLV
jgi:hypothetical protein